MNREAQPWIPYAPALSSGSPVATYAAMSSSVSARHPDARAIDLGDDPARPRERDGGEDVVRAAGQAPQHARRARPRRTGLPSTSLPCDDRGVGAEHDASGARAAPAAAFSSREPLDVLRGAFAFERRSSTSTGGDVDVESRRDEQFAAARRGGGEDQAHARMIR